MCFVGVCSVGLYLVYNFYTLHMPSVGSYSIQVDTCACACGIMNTLVLRARWKLTHAGRPLFQGGVYLFREPCKSERKRYCVGLQQLEKSKNNVLCDVAVLVY